MVLCPTAPSSNDMTDAESRVQVANRAARAGADVAIESFRTDLAVDTKDAKTDVVTQTDRDAQARVTEIIKESFSDDAIVGEEADARKDVPDTGAAWIIDPIDGTSNYVRGERMWGTSVACVVDGECVAAANVFPALNDTYVAGLDGVTRNGDTIAVSDESDPEAGMVSPTLWWDFDHREEFAAAVTEVVERFGDLRRIGCAQGTLSSIACGGLDAAISNIEPNPWDTVAGVFMIEQAGGTVTDLDGNRWRHDSVGLVASNGYLHDEALAAVQAISG
jgi:myo-inositol-1(or 4)-monophosphatase